MKVDTGLPIHDLSRVPEAAQRAEALGYDGALTPETGHDPFLAHALAAEHTERIGLGTAVAIAFPRSPMATAQIAGDSRSYSSTGNRAYQVLAYLSRRTPPAGCP